jgi:AraC-like DNA-binding protein
LLRVGKLLNIINYLAKSNIFFSCAEKTYRTVEANVDEHALIYLYEGSLTVTDIHGNYEIKEGEAMLFYKNMLAKFVKNPAATVPFHSVAIAFSKSFLTQYYADNKPGKQFKPQIELCNIAKHPLLTSLFDSILPYYEMQGDTLPAPLSDLKLKEAMTILRTVEEKSDNILANFSGQGKLDLLDFMQKHYAFNISLERFAYLTGRSLATFKRDFQKAFHTSPQKWIVEKSLKEAYFQIIQKNKRPSDVYLEVGFENLSHFYCSFKQYFGYNP